VRLKNSVVLITGASSGIGEATALAFAKKGARLALCARRLERLQTVAKRCREAGSPKVTTKRVDVSRRTEARAFVAGALRDFERVDILVNNAGLGWAGPLIEMPEERVRALVDTNLLGVTWTTQAALEAMLAARSGVIINVSSIAGVRAAPYSALYSATKHAVTGLSHALRGELSGTGVKVCAVYPAVTTSEFFSVSGGRALGPVYPAAWVANLIVRTARFPRRDAMVFPFRVAHLAEPFLGGLIDHVVGEVRRKAEPDASP
jgi:NADP-dependent 3-hydroxy acid dehydrogenase YdfG